MKWFPSDVTTSFSNVHAFINLHILHSPYGVNQQRGPAATTTAILGHTELKRCQHVFAQTWRPGSVPWQTGISKSRLRHWAPPTIGLHIHAYMYKRKGPAAWISNYIHIIHCDVIAYPSERDLPKPKSRISNTFCSFLQVLILFPWEQSNIRPSFCDTTYPNRLC